MLARLRDCETIYTCHSWRKEIVKCRDGVMVVAFVLFFSFFFFLLFFFSFFFYFFSFACIYLHWVDISTPWLHCRFSFLPYVCQILVWLPLPPITVNQLKVFCHRSLTAAWQDDLDVPRLDLDICLQFQKSLFCITYSFIEQNCICWSGASLKR